MVLNNNPKKLAVNTALFAITIGILNWALHQIDLVPFNAATLLLGALTVTAAAFTTYYVRKNRAERFGYAYEYEFSPAYSIASFLVSARFYGALPVYHVGGTKLHVDETGRLGYPNKGVNRADLSHISGFGVLINLLFAMLFVAVAATTSQGAPNYIAFLFAFYGLFNLVPYPRSNGLNIFVESIKAYTTYLVITLFVILLTLIA